MKNQDLKNRIYQPYLKTNTKIALNKPININGKFKKLYYPKIGIYHGPGASHSWLWFVEILDAMGFWDIDFLDDQAIRSKGLDNLQVLLVSGGDTFAIAESLGKKGAENIKGFLAKGGLYIGSCAGAYLPLKSSLFPLNLFNFASVKIANLTKILPKPVTLPEKFCTSYGCNYVFHPVREEVKIRMLDPSFLKQNEKLVAPLYGGPSFLSSEDVKPLALYTGFTERTLFLTDHQLAVDTLIDKSAIVTKKIGKGRMFLLGPHLEHPLYLKANTIIADMIHQGMSEWEHTEFSAILSNVTGSEKKILPALWRDIQSEVSNSRIVALSLERKVITWQIGQKTYEPVKIRAFLEMVWSRLTQIEQLNGKCEADKILRLRSSFKNITQILRAIKISLDNDYDTTDKAVILFSIIKDSCADYFRIYFNNKLSSLINSKLIDN